MSNKFSSIHNNSNSFKYALGITDQIPNNIEINGGLKPAIAGLERSDGLPPIKKGKKNRPGSSDSQNPPSLSTATSSIPKVDHTNSFKMFAQDTKLSELENKIILMEQNQYQLISKLREYDLQNEVIKSKHNIQTEEENGRQNRIERIVEMLKDQSASEKNELKSKIELIEEIVSREEKVKIDQRLRDIELYKQMISSLTEKVTETVKLEIDARFKADLENKQLAQNIGQFFQKELDNIKYQIEELSVQQSTKNKEVSKDCSERALAITKYIDSQIEGNNDGHGKNLISLKNFVLKLTEELKVNMKNQELVNNNLTKRIKDIEGTSKLSSESSITSIKELEDRIISKIRDYKNYYETLVRNNITYVFDKVQVLGRSVDLNLEAISKGQQEENMRVARKIDELEKQQVLQFKAFSSDLDDVLLPTMKLYEDRLESYEAEINKMKSEIEKNLASVISRIEIKDVNDKIVRTLEYNELTESISKVKSEILDFGLNMNYEMGDMATNFKSTFMNLFERSKIMFERLNKMNEDNNAMFDFIEKTMEENTKDLKEHQDRIEIANMMNEMISNVEKREIDSDIANLKLADDLLNERCNNIKKMVLQEAEIREDCFIANDVKTVMDKVLSEFDKVDQMNFIETRVSSTEEMIALLEDNIDNKFKSTDEEVLRIEEASNSKFEIVNQMLRTKKDIENAEEIKRIEEELAEKRRAEVRTESLIKENQKFREMLEVKSMMEEMLNKFEFRNIYSNFEKIDKKLVKYDDDSINLKVKLRLNDNRLNKVEVGLTDLSSYVNDEILMKIISERMLTQISLDYLQDEINNGIKIVQDEEKELDRFNKTFDNKSKELELKLEEIGKGYEDQNNQRHKEVLENMESRLIKSLEKVKQDNVNMWTHSIALQQKLNNTEEVRKIIQTIPPVIFDRETSMKRIYELEHENNKNPKPTLVKAAGSIDKLNKEIEDKQKKTEVSDPQKNKQPNNTGNPQQPTSTDNQQQPNSTGNQQQDNASKSGSKRQINNQNESKNKLSEQNQQIDENAEKKRKPK